MVSEIEQAWCEFLWRIAVDTDELLQRAERIRKEDYGNYDREESQEVGRDPRSTQARHNGRGQSGLHRKG